MKRLAFMLLFLSGTTSLPAQDNGIDQDLEVVTYPSGEHVIVWYGHVGRSYFLQVSDPVDHLNKWHWENIIEEGNDEPISHEVGGTGDKGFYRLKYTDKVPGPGETLDTADFDGDGLSNWVEINTYQTDPLNLDSDGDGIPDGWELAHGLNPNDSTDAANLFPGSYVTNLQAFNAGVQANANATPTNKDGDGLNDAEDADPNDSEINWPKTPEARYIWIEQVDEVDINHQPRAVNKHGQILFCDTRSYYGLNTISDPKNLWNSATKEWVALPLNGSQEIDIVQNTRYITGIYNGATVVIPPGQHVFNFYCPVSEFIDINDEGTVYGICLGNDYDLIDPLIPGMFWKRTGPSLAQYAAPAYFYPRYPFPAAWGQSVVKGSYPGGAIANDGTINSYASHGSVFNDWMTYDSSAFDSNPASTESMQSVRVCSGTIDGANTFPGAVLDKDRALFVETINLGQGAKQCRLWLKEGAAQTDLSFMTPQPVSLAEMSLAPEPRTGGGDRLWISTGPSVFLEKRAGGTGSDRWHEPDSMAEGAIRLNTRGEAITGGDPATELPPKLWRNGKYHALNDVTDGSTNVEITRAIDLASNGIILAQAIEGGVKKTGILIPVEINVDANRDGEITSDGRDRTTLEEPFRFWVNNDQDNVESDEPIDVTEPDSLGAWIGTRRDLEDFCRLRIKVGVEISALLSGDIRVGVKFSGTNPETPSIGCFDNQSLSGNNDYLTDFDAADRQKSFIGFPRDYNTGITMIPVEYWARRYSSTAHLIFEGRTKGLGKLVVTIHDKNGLLLGEGGETWIRLLDIREMYKRARIVNDAEQIPHPWENQNPPAQTWVWDPNGYQYVEDPNATDQTAIFVHGWRLTNKTYLNWADTSYKRLWHQGFKGKFYTFRWATFSGDDNGLPDFYDDWLEGLDSNLVPPPAGFTYNASEYRAWLCGPALANFVNQLPGEAFSLFAHSMGNVIAGSALRSGMNIDHYALCNAAVSAMCYDSSSLLHGNGNIWPFPTPPGYLQVTPDTHSNPTVREYGLNNKFNYNDLQMHNFTLSEDSALFNWIRNNQIFKPEGPVYSYNIYDTSLIWPLDLDRVNPAGSVHRPVYSLPEAMGYVTKSLTAPAGRTPFTRGAIDSTVGMDSWFGDVHSAQWRWNYLES